MNDFWWSESLVGRSSSSLSEGWWSETLIKVPDAMASPSAAQCRRKSLSLTQPRRCLSCVVCGHDDVDNDKKVAPTNMTTTEPCEQERSVSPSLLSVHSPNTSKVSSLCDTDNEVEQDPEVSTGKMPFCTPPKIPQNRTSFSSDSSFSVGHNEGDSHLHSRQSGNSKTYCSPSQNHVESPRRNNIRKQGWVCSFWISRLSTTLIIAVLLVLFMFILHYDHFDIIVNALSECKPGNYVLSITGQNTDKLPRKIEVTYRPGDGITLRPVTCPLLHQTENLLNAVKVTIAAVLQDVYPLTLEAAYIYVVVAGGVIAVAIVIVTYFRLQPIEEFTEDVANFVERIIRILVEHHRVCPSDNPYLSVSQVRDLLIAPHDRKRLKKVWEKAVRIIEKENLRGRIVMENTDVGTKIWRYLPGTLTETSSSRLQPSQNSFGLLTPVSATPCLRIHYMFDVESAWGDNWVQFLKNCILEPRNEVRILLFWVAKIDWDEGIIYIKCASNEDARKVRRFLEMWFYGRKYEITYITHV